MTQGIGAVADHSFAAGRGVASQGTREQSVITFQSIMFVALGFLSAILLAFIIAPAFWRRAVRLTTERMRASLPLTEREIRAEQDRVRADNAIHIYRLSAERDKARLAASRQTIEINRRDAAIGEVGRRLERVEAEHEASENARRVLEATIKERVPEIERRLMEARQLLAHRDREMTALREESSKTFRALDEAMQMSAQQRGEIERLKTALTGRTGRPQTAPEGVETETALRSELERLRARTRDQAGVIKRLQEAMRAGGMAGDSKARRADAADISEHEKHAAELAAVQEGLEASREALIAQVKTLSKKVEQQAGEVADLKAELARAEEAAGDRGLAARGRRKAAQQSRGQEADALAERDKTIAELRRELALANERIARQATYYMEELRRLGPRPAGRGETVRSERRGAGNGAHHDPSVADRAVEASKTEVSDAWRADVVPGADGLDADGAGAEVDARAGGGEPRERSAAQQASGSDVMPAGAREEEKAVVAETPPAAPRSKLMDRIAGISKR